MFLFSNDPAVYRLGLFVTAEMCHDLSFVSKLRFVMYFEDLPPCEPRGINIFSICTAVILKTYLTRTISVETRCGHKIFKSSNSIVLL